MWCAPIGQSRGGCQEQLRCSRPRQQPATISNVQRRTADQTKGKHNDKGRITGAASACEHLSGFSWPLGGIPEPGTGEFGPRPTSVEAAQQLGVSKYLGKTLPGRYLGWMTRCIRSERPGSARHLPARPRLPLIGWRGRPVCFFLSRQAASAGNLSGKHERGGCGQCRSRCSRNADAPGSGGARSDVQLGMAGRGGPPFHGAIGSDRQSRPRAQARPRRRTASFGPLAAYLALGPEQHLNPRVQQS